MQNRSNPFLNPQAKFALEFSDAVYYDEKAELGHFTCLETLESPDKTLRVRYYRDNESGALYVAFRGSDNWENWLRDNRKLVCGNEYSKECHDFLENAEKRIVELNSNNGEVICTGHSLGSSFAVYLSAKNKYVCFAWDCPGVPGASLDKLINQNNDINWNDIHVYRMPRNLVNHRFNCPVQPHLLRPTLLDHDAVNFSKLDDEENYNHLVTNSVFHQMVHIKEAFDKKIAAEELMIKKPKNAIPFINSKKSGVKGLFETANSAHQAVQGDAKKQARANNLPHDAAEKPSAERDAAAATAQPTAQTFEEQIIQLDKIDAEINRTLAQVNEHMENLKGAQKDDGEQKNKDDKNKKPIMLPEQAVQAVAALAEGLYQFSRVNNRARDAKKMKEQLLDYCKQLGSAYGANICEKKYSGAVSLVETYRRVSMDVYAGMYDQLTQIRNYCSDNIKEVRRLRGEISHRKVIIHSCESFIKKYNRDQKNIIKKIRNIDYNNIAGYCAAGMRLGATITAAYPIASAMFATAASVWQFIDDGNQNRFQRRMTRYQQMTEGLQQKIGFHHDIIDRNSMSIGNRHSVMQQLKNEILAYYQYGDYDECKEALNESLADNAEGIDACRSEIEKLNNKITTAQNSKTEYDQYATVLKRLEAEYDYREDHHGKKNDEGLKSWSKSKLKKEIKKYEKQVDKLEEKKDGAPEIILDASETITGLESLEVTLEKEQKEIIKAQVHLNNIKDIKQFWDEIRPPKPELTEDELKFKQIHDFAEEQYNAAMHDLEKGTQQYKQMIGGFKNVAAALQRLGVEQPARYMEIVDSVFEMGKIFSSFEFTNFKKFFDHFEVTKSFEKAIDLCGGKDRFLAEILNPSINLVGLGLNIIALLINLQPKDPVLMTMQRHFESMYQYMDKRFNDLEKIMDKNDEHLNRKLDLIKFSLRRIEVALGNVQESVDDINKKLGDVNKVGTYAEAKARRVITLTTSNAAIKTHDDAIYEMLKTIKSKGNRSDESPKVVYLKDFLDRMHDDNYVNPGSANVAERPYLYVRYLFDKIIQSDSFRVVNPKIYFAAGYQLIAALEKFEAKKDLGLMVNIANQISSILGERIYEGYCLYYFLKFINKTNGKSLLETQIWNLRSSYIQMRDYLKTQLELEQGDRVVKCKKAAVNYLKRFLPDAINVENMTKELGKDLVGFKKFLLSELLTNELALTAGFKLDKYKVERKPKNIGLDIFRASFLPIIGHAALIAGYVSHEGETKENIRYLNNNKGILSNRLIEGTNYNIFNALFFNPTNNVFVATHTSNQVWSKHLMDDHEEDACQYMNFQYTKNMKFINSSPIKVGLGCRTRQIGDDFKVYSTVKINGHEIPYNLVVESPYSYNIYSLKLSKNGNDNKKLEMEEYRKKYNDKNYNHVKNYYELISEKLKNEAYDKINASQLKIENGELIPSGDPNLLPLILPSNYLSKLAEYDIKLKSFYQQQNNGKALVSCSYHFAKTKNDTGKDIYLLKLRYTLLQPDIGDKVDISSYPPLGEKIIEIFEFDAVTVESFKMYSPAEFINLNEFLITAVYGGKLACNRTKVLDGSGLICPAEINFPGLYGILNTENSQIHQRKFVFDHRNFDESTLQSLAEKFTVLRLSKPAHMFEAEVKRRDQRIHQKDITLLPTFLPHFDNLKHEYQCLIALIRLVANLNENDAKEMVFSRLGIAEPLESAMQPNELIATQFVHTNIEKLTNINREDFIFFCADLKNMRSNLYADMKYLLLYLQFWKDQLNAYKAGAIPAALPNMNMGSRQWKPGEKQLKLGNSDKNSHINTVSPVAGAANAEMSDKDTSAPPGAGSSSDTSAELSANKTNSVSLSSSSMFGSDKRSQSNYRKIPTEGGGDCALHAALGDLLNGKITSKEIDKQRLKLADMIRKSKNNPELFEFIVSGIQETVTSEVRLIGNGAKRAIEGVHLAALRVQYLKSMKQEEANMKIAWDEIEAILRANELGANLNAHTSIVSYIETKFIQMKGIEYENKSLKFKFDHVWNEARDDLKEKVEAIPALVTAINKYNEKSNSKYILEKMVNDNVLNDYADLLKQAGAWLGQEELPLLAYSFDIALELYILNNNEYKLKDTYNPRAEKKVRIAFNGVNHFERIDSVNSAAQPDERQSNDGKSSNDMRSGTNPAVSPAVNPSACAASSAGLFSGGNAKFNNVEMARQAHSYQRPK